MINVYEIETPAQFALLADELQATIPSMASEFEEDRTVEAAWSDLQQYIDQRPHAGIWVALDNGELTAWSAAKVYIDLPNTITAAVTWAWARSGARDAPTRLHLTMCDWARERQVIALYAARKTRLDAYARWVGRHGYRYDRVIFVHRLTDAAAPALKEESHELRRQRVQLPAPGGDDGTRRAPPPGDAVRSTRTRAHRANGKAARNGDLGAAAAGGVEPAGRGSGAELHAQRVNGKSPGTKREWNGRRWIRSSVTPPRRTRRAEGPPDA
jgi:hypothetical protein